MFIPFVLTIAFVGLVIAGYTDIKTREVPDWLNFCLIATGLGARLTFSIVAWDKGYFIEGLFGFGLGLVLAYGMFYSGQWGGGDSKMLMGLGALLGLQFRFDGYLISFLVNLLFVGALYGFVWSVILAVRHRHAFSRKIEKSLSKKAFKRLRFAGIIVVLAAIAASLRLHDFWQRLVLVVVGLFFYLLLYLWVFVKAVEESCMLKWVDPRKLTEGDWIAKEVRVRGKYICGPKDLGITKKQIMETIRLARKNKIKRVLIKEGIPFVPSFLITLVLTIGYGNMILLLVAR